MYNGINSIRFIKSGDTKNKNGLQIKKNKKKLLNEFQITFQISGIFPKKRKNGVIHARK
jgi:hypothetical protein